MSKGHKLSSKFLKVVCMRSMQQADTRAAVPLVFNVHNGCGITITCGYKVPICPMLMLPCTQFMLPFSVCVCVCACVCVCMHACVRACICVCTCVRVCACVRTLVSNNFCCTACVPPWRLRTRAKFGLSGHFLAQCALFEP